MQINIEKREPFFRKTLLEIALPPQKRHQINEVLAGSQTIAGIVRAAAVPAAFSRIVQGDHVLLARVGLQQMLAFEHLTFNHCELLALGAFLAIFQRLAPDFIFAETRLFPSSIRRRALECRFPAPHDVANVQQNRHRMLASVPGVRATAGNVDAIPLRWIYRGWKAAPTD